MSPLDRKTAFRHQADRDGKTLSAAAHEYIGVTWDHLRGGIAGTLPLSAETKQKFAAYIGRDMEDVFGATSSEAA